ncbi:MAG: phosphate acyltransferase [Ruminococcaceae bacterium]|nr:phosphate acyltransferase [Oscillospiraceae bacterium]
MAQYKIAVDVMGSDKGPEMMIRGVGAALNAHAELSVCLFGDENIIKRECQANGLPTDRVEIVGTTEIITNFDSPSTALFQKTDSSLVRALAAAAQRDDIVGVINAGSTGALIAGSMRYLSTPDRVRPALAAVLPAENGGFTCLVDTGATIDCGASTLVHFAHLGTSFMKDLYKIDTPRVALLSNGAEPTKGNKAVKEAHAMLAQETDINFVGNVEGTNALSGACDVLVCDGFAGNQVLKVTEGIAKRIITDIVKYAKQTGKEEYMQLVGYLASKYDLASLGGGIILGIRKPVIKAHGAANEKSISSVIEMMLNLAANIDVFNGKH